MGSGNELKIQSVLGPKGTGNINRSDYAILQSQFLNTLGNQSLNNTVAAAAAVSGSLNNGFRFLINRHVITPPWGGYSQTEFLRNML